MKIKQFLSFSDIGLDQSAIEEYREYQLVLAFGNRHLLEEEDIYSKLKSIFPQAEIVLSSTAGQILGPRYIRDGIVITAVKLEHSEVKAVAVKAEDYENSLGIGKDLLEKMPTENLKHIFILSDGQAINGSELVQGLYEGLPGNIGVTGGLAGDDARFEKTLVSLNGSDNKKLVVALGFYGERLKVTYGSQGGWTAFGPERLVTKSEKNVLYELDGQSALDLYKKYLGELSNELPGSALLFPLCIRTSDNNETLVRTILSVDEEDQSMTFAGNVPEGCYARLMKSNSESLIDGAHDAAEDCMLYDNKKAKPELSIMVSCIGRRIVLDQLVEEEVEEALRVLGSPPNTGFYSYGEICPILENSRPELHNQTMTITTFSEI